MVQNVPDASEPFQRGSSPSPVWFRFFSSLADAYNGTVSGIAGAVAAVTDVFTAASGKTFTTELIESASAFVALTEASGAVAVDWDTFINGEVTVDEDTVISNPTNGQPGTYRSILVKGNNSTDRTITFGNQFLGDVPAITDCDSDKWYLLVIFCITTTHFVVSSKVANT